MPNPWMPELIRDPGRSAGYNGGQCRMQWIKHHDTAGTDSYTVCRWGRAGYNVSLCQILIPKTGTPWQFCEIDAICADSGNWNPWGPGIEVERLGAGQAGLSEKQPLTDSQTDWLHRINLWLLTEWHVPNVQYRGPQFGAEGFTGHVSHSDIAYNPDGLTYAEWDAVTAPTTPEEEDDMYHMTDPKHRSDWYAVDGNCKRKLTPSEKAFMAYVGKQAIDVDQAWFDSLYTPPINSGDLTNIGAAVWNANSRTLTD